MSNDGMWEQENRELRKELGDTQVRANHLESECERLRADNQALQELRDSAMKLYGKANERIEELEESHEILCKEIDYCCDNHQGNHFVTDKRIDAAWAEAYSFGTMSRGAINALAELGIERCEGCGGSGDELPPPGGGKICRTCNGRGWVKNG